MVPRATTREGMQSPEFAEKLRQGPVMVVTVIPNGPFSMGRSLGLRFLYLVAVAVFTACVALKSLDTGADYATVFKLVAVTAFGGYALALWQMSIWYRRAWSTTLKATVDGVIYALLTAGTFGWLWPR